MLVVGGNGDNTAEVARLRAAGLSIRQIARELGVSAAWVQRALRRQPVLTPVAGRERGAAVATLLPGVFLIGAPATLDDLVRRASGALAGADPELAELVRTAAARDTAELQAELGGDPDDELTRYRWRAEADVFHSHVLNAIQGSPEAQRAMRAWLRDVAARVGEPLPVADADADDDKDDGWI